MIPSVKITDLDIQMVKDYLRIDHDDDDEFLNIILVSARSYIQSYLNLKFDDFEEIPDEFTIACLAICAHWYENRQVQQESNGKGLKELSYIFSGILDIYRNWNPS